MSGCHLPFFAAAAFLRAHAAFILSLIAFFAAALIGPRFDGAGTDFGAAGALRCAFRLLAQYLFILSLTARRACAVCGPVLGLPAGPEVRPFNWVLSSAI